MSQGHDGYTTAKFLELINEYVMKIAEDLYAAELIREKVPQLTLLEVIAIRLYTGPGNKPVCYYTIRYVVYHGMYNVILCLSWYLLN